jgi:hypothetical protein
MSEHIRVPRVHKTTEYADGKLHRIHYVTALLGATILIVFWLVIATFPSFFFFNPVGHGNQIRRLALVLTTIGWVLQSTITPMLLFLHASGIKRARSFLPISGLFYPIALIFSHTALYIDTGTSYLRYLINFPIFIFTDVLLPILVLFIWHDLKEKPGDGF